MLPARPPKRQRYPVRLPEDDRTALRGIVYVLRTGVTWAGAPTERISRSGVTAWRRLRDWTETSVWLRLHEILLAERRKAGQLDMDDAAVDGSHVRALKEGSHRTFAGRARASGQQAPPDHRPARHPPARLAWLHQFKRLQIRYEIRADLHLGILQVAWSIICLRPLRTSF